MGVVWARSLQPAKSRNSMYNRVVSCYQRVPIRPKHQHSDVSVRFLSEGCFQCTQSEVGTVLKMFRDKKRLAVICFSPQNIRTVACGCGDTSGESLTEWSRSTCRKEKQLCFGIDLSFMRRSPVLDTSLTFFWGPPPPLPLSVEAGSLVGNTSPPTSCHQLRHW